MTTPIKVSEHVDTVRGSGKTTAQALQACAYALCNPGVWVTVEDHIKNYGTHKGLMVKIGRILDHLGIPFLVNSTAVDGLPQFQVHKHGTKEEVYVKRQ